MATILLLNGPNLNRLGTREPEKYGHRTLPEIEAQLARTAQQHEHTFYAFQSNHEGELIDTLHLAKPVNASGSSNGPLKTPKRFSFNSTDLPVDFILFNPGAFTHTCIALRDALLAVDIPFTEIHLTNTHAREPFRKTSYFSDIAEGVISGFGALSYELALSAALSYLADQQD